MKLISVFSFLIIIMVLIESGDSLRSQETDEAYVTLLYGDNFLLGVRVLGKSIRDTGSTKDMVVLVSNGVSDYAIKLLDADGWIVTRTSLIANPNQDQMKRLWGVYTKLKVFNMTNYKKVVYLDADTVVIKNIEHIFKCGKFCANLKHSERFNAGVMVVEPSKFVFDDMMSKVNILYSYSADDQGFLHSYYPDFADTHIFDPNLPQKVLNSRPVQRLTTLYNAEVSQYIISNKWKVNETEIHVLHFTIGPFKPWDWWSSWVLKPVDIWQNYREKLEESLPGTGGGKNPNDELLVKFLFFLPLCALLCINYRQFVQTRQLCRKSLLDYIRYFVNTIISNVYAVGASSTIYNSAINHVPACLNGVSILVCFASALVSAKVSLAIVPRHVTPWTGFIIMMEWIFTIFFILFGGFLHLIHFWGKMTANQVLESNSDYELGKGHNQRDVATWHYWFGMAFLAIVTPCLPSLFGTTSLFGWIVLIASGTIVLVSFMTHAAENLAIIAFSKGFQDRDTSRLKTIRI